MIRSKLNRWLNVFFRVIVYSKSSPEVIYSGLRNLIGKSREIEKNAADESSFENLHDLRIPVEFTT
jgi:hypothetical protein